MIKEILKKNNKNSGFTIIETMIAISLFLVVVMMGMGALLNANVLHNKAQKMRSIMDNLSFIMEDMSRNLRTGSTYHCIDANDTLAALDTARSGPDCSGIAFESATGDPTTPNDQWVYFIDNSSGTGKIFKSTTGFDGGNFVQLNPDEVNIDPNASGFFVLGAEPPPGDTQQPFVIIRLVGTITYQSVTTPFSLQTSVSQRLIDVAP